MDNLIELETANSEFQKYICFQIGINRYAVPVLNILEVMKLPKLDYPQKLPSNFVGVLKFNNIVLNVLDIRFYLDIEVEPYSILNNLLLVKTDECIFGIIVDEIIDITDFEKTKIEYMPFISDSQIIDSIYTNKDGNSVSILNILALEKIIKNGYEDKGKDVNNLFPKDENSLKVLNERRLMLTKRMDLSINQNVFGDNKFLSFELNSTIYGINLKYIKEISKVSNMIKLPTAPEYVEGLMSIRGDFYTILNLKKFLNFSKTEYLNQKKVLIIDSNVLKFGFLLDEIEDIVDVSEEQMNKTSQNSETYIDFEIIDKNSIMYVLNMEKILSDEKLYIEEN